MLSMVMETVETEQRTLHVVCGDGNRAEDIVCCLWGWKQSRGHCTLSVVMETEQRTLHVVCGDGNRAEDIACCLW